MPIINTLIYQKQCINFYIPISIVLSVNQHKYPLSFLSHQSFHLFLILTILFIYMYDSHLYKTCPTLCHYYAKNHCLGIA